MIFRGFFSLSRARAFEGHAAPLVDISTRRDFGAAPSVHRMTAVLKTPAGSSGAGAGWTPGRSRTSWPTARKQATSVLMAPTPACDLKTFYMKMGLLAQNEHYLEHSTFGRCDMMTEA